MSGVVSAANPLSTFPQPKIHHDNQNTGQSQYIGPQTNRTKWKYQTGYMLSSPTSPIIGKDGTIYVGGAGSDDFYLYAINHNGTLKWKYLKGNPISSSPAINSDGTIYVGTDHYLYAINPDGTLKWECKIGWVLSSPTIDSDGTIYVGSFDHNLYAINPDGTLKWTYTTGSYLRCSPSIGSDGTIYIGTSGETSDDNLYAINPDGTLKWKYSIIDPSDAAIGSDGTIYVGSFDNKLYALNPDGTLKWTFTTGYSNGCPAVSYDGTIYVASGDGTLWALNPDGSPKWKYTTLNVISVSPTIGSDGTVYIGSDDYRLYAINPDGTLKWKYRTKSRVETSPAIDSDGTLYVGSLDGYLYAIQTVHNITVKANPNSGVYYSNKLITLKANYPATIYYRFYGLTPTVSSAVYTHPITITKNTILKYFAIDSYGDISPIYTKYYTIRHITPKVTSTSPINGYKMFSRIGMIKVMFDKKVKPSITYNKITVKNLSTNKYVRIIKAIVGNTLFIKTSNTRSSNTWYQVTITQWAVKDYAGHKLQTTYKFKFKTRA